MKIISPWGRMLLLAFFFSAVTSIIYAQNTALNGVVKDKDSGNPLIGVSIQVKGRVVGTITNADGTFGLTVQSAPPFTLVFSSVGYRTEEIEVSGGQTHFEVALEEQAISGQEIVISASRVEESVMNSPVSIEKIDVRTIRETPQVSFYDALQNLKGVEMNTQSVTFRSVSARGFGANGNVRLVQLVDGMDNQAPGLNFPVGNVVGMSELDVESVELLPGAASALYGPNAINGLLLMNSKSPFVYQGLSAYAKAGIMSADNRTQKNTPYYDVAIRYARSFNNKLAFKVNAAYLTAKDWQATDYRDQSLTNGSTLENNTGNIRNNPTYDGVNWLGDVGTNVYDALYANGIPGDGSNGTSAALGAIYSTQIAAAGNLTLPQLLGGTTPEQQLAIARNIFGTVVPNQYLAAPGYAENQLTDYPVKSLKLNASLHYRLSDKIEAILQANWGKGSAVYTAADRYNIQDFTLGQYKAEIKGDNFFVRGYTTRENSGNAHALGVLGGLMSRNWIQSVLGSFVQTGLTQYGGALLQGYTAALQSGMSQEEAMALAYGQANAYAQANNGAWLETGAQQANGLFLPGGTQFDSSTEQLKSIPIAEGARFLDKTNMYHAEAMYNFKNLIDPKVIELIVGGNYRVYDLNSEGTLFTTKDGTPTGDEFNIKEYGAYAQVGRNFNDKVKLTASLRYDKNENFEGQFSPRFSAVWTFIKDHNLRASYQRGFRIPTTQNQYIDLLTPQARLIGGLPLFRQKYNMNTNPVFALTDIQSGNFAPYEFKEWEPERVQTFEVGYKTTVNNRVFLDAYYYYNRFLTFEGNVVLLQRKDASGPMTDLLDAGKRNVFSMPVNAEQVIKNSGFGIGVDFVLGKGFVFNTNFSKDMMNNDDELQETNPSFITYFNSPDYRYNVGLSNRDIMKSGWGFGITLRGQGDMVWQGSISPAEILIRRQTVIPAYTTLDAQISKKTPGIKSIVKVGGTNLTGKLYTTGWANPSVGSMYYVSLTFDELFR